MNTNSIFTFLIFCLIFVLIVLIVRICIITSLGIKITNRSDINLQHQIDLEERKNSINLSSIQLLDEYNEALINRLFVIIKDILLVQKLIFGKHDK